MKLPITGGCQCGHLRFEIRAEPMTVYTCHCTECQKQSASTFGLSVIVPRESFVITQGTPKIWVRKHESGRLIDCLFCPECGTRICHNPQANQKVTIARAGTFDDASWVHPVGHIWTRSAQPWFKFPEGALTYEQQQPNLDKMIEAWKAQPH